MVCVRSLEDDAVLAAEGAASDGGVPAAGGGVLWGVPPRRAPFQCGSG